jgi:hypothetical protein
MPRQTKTRAAVCALSLLGLLSITGQATAQSEGVHVDPDTPAGKEYALPLDKARQDVAPTAGAQGSEPGEAELFGAGISKKGGGGGGDGSQKQEGAGGGGNGGSGDGGTIDAPAVAKAAASSSSGISSGWLTALIAAGVLLVGGIAGLSLRALRAT